MASASVSCATAPSVREGKTSQEKAVAKNSHFTIMGSPNIEFVVVDPNGRRQGRDPIANKVYKEVKTSMYFRELPQSADDDAKDDEMVSQVHGAGIHGDYSIEVYGLSPGPYSLYVDFVDDGRVIKKTIEGKIDKNEKLVLKMGHSKGKLVVPNLNK